MQLNYLLYKLILILDCKIIFDDKEITSMPKTEMIKLRGKGVGMIFQDPMTSLNPVFTVGNQIEESLKKHTHLDRKQRKERSIDC